MHACSTDGLRKEDARKCALVMRAICDGIWDWKIKTGAVAFDPRYYTMVGFEPFEFPGTFDEWAKRVHPDDLARAKKAIQDHFEGRTPQYQAEFRFKTKQGEWAWILSRGSVIERDEQGKPTRMVGTHEDISSRKAAEAERERLVAILDTTSDLVFTATAEGHVTYMNCAGRNMLGWAGADVSGGKLIADAHPDWATHIVLTEGIPKAIDTGVWQGETAIVAPDGAEIPVSQVIMAHKLPDGQLEYLSTIMRDITDRKRAHEEREKMIDELEARNAELERFTYTVSHDLKGPLITLEGYLGLLREDIACGDSEAIENDMQRMENATRTMARLLSDLLELSRIGRLINPSHDVPLAELAHETVELLSGLIGKRGVVVEIAPNLPVVHGDRQRLLEVLQNLVENAAKYMGEQANPRIEIGARRDGNETVCFVRDNGIGVEPCYQERIFELFQQLDQRIEGTGIGLALVKRIIEVHGGRVWVESEGKARGATFCFTLPGTSETTVA